MDWIQIYLFLFNKNQRLEILYLRELDFKNKHGKVSFVAFLSDQTTACSIILIICQRMDPHMNILAAAFLKTYFVENRHIS